MDWRDSGACLNEDPDLFFPTGTNGSVHREIEAAKSVCRRCSVQEACLRWALDAGPLSGVWGGTTEEERRRWAKRQAQQGDSPVRRSA